MIDQLIFPIDSSLFRQVVMIKSRVLKTSFAKQFSHDENDDGSQQTSASQ